MKKTLLPVVITAFIGTGLMLASFGGTTTTVPEPVFMMFLGTTLVGLAGVARSKNNRSNK